ncbi:MAG TPA: hypothetical protein VFT55_05390 [Planctomycetota bacterium]|nr:hypothetical protein [Planctomycetota bacterium]
MDCRDAARARGDSDARRRRWLSRDPEQQGLLGTDLFATAAVFQVPPVNPFGAITANGLKGHIGNL